MSVWFHVSVLKSTEPQFAQPRRGKHSLKQLALFETWLTKRLQSKKQLTGDQWWKNGLYERKNTSKCQRKTGNSGTNKHKFTLAQIYNIMTEAHLHRSTGFSKISGSNRGWKRINMYLKWFWLFSTDCVGSALSFYNVNKPNMEASPRLSMCHP